MPALRTPKQSAAACALRMRGTAMFGIGSRHGKAHGHAPNGAGGGGAGAAPKRRRFLRGARRWAARVGVAFMTALLVLQGAPTVALASVLTNTSAQNQQTLSALKSITGDEATAESYYALMQQYGLLNEGGEAVESWQIRMDGRDVSLDDIRSMLAGAYDPDAEVEVDGTKVTLANLATMLEIEDYVAYVRETYFSDEEEWGEEQLEALESLRNQVQTTGIQIAGEGGGVAFPSGIDHNARVSMELSVVTDDQDADTSANAANNAIAALSAAKDGGGAIEKAVAVNANGGATVRATFTLSGGTSDKPVRFVVQTLEGSAEEGVDYEGVSQEIELTPESGTATVDVAVMDRSSVLEGDGLFSDQSFAYWYGSNSFWIYASQIENGLFEDAGDDAAAVQGQVSIVMAETSSLGKEAEVYGSDKQSDGTFFATTWYAPEVTRSLSAQMRYRFAAGMLDTMTVRPKWDTFTMGSGLAPFYWKYGSHGYSWGASATYANEYWQQRITVSDGKDAELYTTGLVGYDIDKMMSDASSSQAIADDITQFRDMTGYLKGGVQPGGKASSAAATIKLEEAQRRVLADSGELKLSLRYRKLKSQPNVLDEQRSYGMNVSVSFADTTAPELMGLSVPADVTFGAGDIIPVTAEFSEQVKVDGAVLTLSDGTKLAPNGNEVVESPDVPGEMPSDESVLWLRYRSFKLEGMELFQNGSSYATLDEWLASKDNVNSYSKDTALLLIELAWEYESGGRNRR